MIEKPMFLLNALATETQKLVKRQLWAKIVLCLILGLAVGYLIGPEMNILSSKTSQVISDWLALPGRVFLILMQMIVVPLVMSSVILGVINSESLERLKEISIRLVPYFVLTTTVSILLGFTAAKLMDPGKYIDSSKLSISIENETELDKTEKKSLPRSITSILPTNPLGSMVDGNLFQIVIFAIMIGVALLSLTREQAEPVVTLLQSIQKITMVIVGWAMYLAPVAVFGLMAELLSHVGLEALKAVGVYSLTVILALIFILIFYALIVALGARRNPLSFFKKLRSVQLLAFSTSSSAAVMPLTIEVAEKELNVSKGLSRLIIPLGTTINMDGTAAYQGVAAFFIAQAYGLDLSLPQLGLIVVSATGASIGAPGTPGVGMAILASILSGIGIPPEGVLLILGVDRILDMLRTVVNVTGDLTATVFFERWLPKNGS